MLSEAEIQTFELMSSFKHVPYESIDDFVANYRAGIGILCHHIREQEVKIQNLEKSILFHMANR